MEWNDNEKKIIGQLQSYTEEVDTGALWRDIRPHLPKRRKHSWVPFFLFFLLGMGAGIGGYYLADSGRHHSSGTWAEDWSQEKSELLQQLKACEQAAGKGSARLMTSSSSSQIPALAARNTVHTGSTPSHAIHSAQKAPSAVPSSEVSEIEPEIHRSETILPTPVLLDISMQVNTPEKIILLPGNTQEPVTPVIPQTHGEPKNTMLHYITAGGGPAFVRDLIKVDNKSYQTVHSPMYHVALEYGQQRRFSKNMMWNMGINYTTMASHIRYQTTHTEEVTLTDTTGYYIGADGVTSSQTGEVLATRRVQKNGITYSYGHRLYLHPSLEYDFPLRKNTSLSVRAGMMWPLISWQKSGLLSPDGDAIKLSPSFTFFENPMLRGGGTYHTTIFHKNIGVYLDFLVGSHKIHTGSFTSVRTFFLPQTGMRIFF